MTKLNERSISNRVENIAVGVHASLIVAVSFRLESYDAIPSGAAVGESTGHKHGQSKGERTQTQPDEC
jgi:hypothetical protein